MAKIKYARTGEELEVKDGADLRTACEKFGLVIVCKDGLCGSCMVNIVEGERNLSKMTPQEINFFGGNKKNRLGCQCKIKRGKVVVDF